MICYLIDNIAHVRSGSVGTQVIWPPGSGNTPKQNYGSADPNPKEKVYLFNNTVSLRKRLLFDIS
jgi:hypothetical protein